MKGINQFLQSITMYRLVLYALGLLALVAIIFGFTATISVSGGAMLRSLSILLIACVGLNALLAAITKAAATRESSIITALILFLIINPPTSVKGSILLALVGVLAIASKYYLAWRGKHIFNPAAFAALAGSLLGYAHTTWWIATSAMLPFVVIVGAAVLHKLHRWQMFGSFLAATIAAVVLAAWLGGGVQEYSDLIKNVLTAWPVIFMGTIMLTEPLTMPARKRAIAAYAVVVGLLLGTRFQLPFEQSVTPELALLVGNIFAFATNMRGRRLLHLTARTELTPALYEFSFTPHRSVHFSAGQYMELTLPHRGQDSRGNRRILSISSSPTEPELRFAVKMSTPSSTYKRALASLPVGSSLSAVRVAGDFVLPANPQQQLVFIAGGIGITPFRSMAQYLLDTQDMRDIVLLYQVPTYDAAAYADVFKRAKSIGLRTVYLLSNKQPPKEQGVPYALGFLTPELIAKIPDWRHRRYYLSGPDAMVDSYKRLLLQAGISRHQIVTDYFSGY